MFRRRVDPRKLAGRAARLEGDLLPESLPRVSALLAGEVHASTVKARLSFETAMRGLVLVSGEVDASLMLQCQRCLDPVCVPVTTAFRLALRDDTGEGDLPPGFESLEAAGEFIVPADLVEEELLLALPFAAAHETVAECGELARQYVSSGAPQPAEQTRQDKHPFAVLKGLKLD